jgi:hypothetical protein
VFVPSGAANACTLTNSQQRQFHASLPWPIGSQFVGSSPDHVHLSSSVPKFPGGCGLEMQQRGPCFVTVASFAFSVLAYSYTAQRLLHQLCWRGLRVNGHRSGQLPHFDMPPLPSSSQSAATRECSVDHQGCHMHLTRLGNSALEHMLKFPRETFL